MRLAGSPQVYEALAKHFASDDIPTEAAHHLAAEVMVHGEDVDTRVDRFSRFYALLKDKGYSDQAAQHLAVEALEGREPEPQATLRFAGTHGSD